VANVFWNVVTGGDPGEGCDFTGTFTYAVNILGPGGFSIGDAAFTEDGSTSGFTVSAQVRQQDALFRHVSAMFCHASCWSHSGPPNQLLLMCINVPPAERDHELGRRL
jgi:hypothetical protein